MKLRLVKVRGYKRFGVQQCLDTRGPVVAIVGPNEAGKTSLLQAIEHLSRDGPFDQSELTDRVDDDGDWIVNAHYSLGKDDRAELGDLLPSDADVTYKVYKYANGARREVVEPHLPRDLTWRQRAAQALASFAERTWLDEVNDAADGQPTLRQRCETLEAQLDTGEDHLPSEALNALVEVAGDLGVAGANSSRPAAFEKLAHILMKTQHAEDELTPAQKVVVVLREREPSFLLFRGGDLDLKTEYVWKEQALPPPALANLLALAGVDYSALRSAATQNDRPTLETLREVADARLKTAFGEWKQSALQVTLSVNETSLEIQIRDHSTAARTRFEDRSDGLRRFVALLAFTATHTRNSTIQPVLLIDEAETHLHYSAQADLVRVFETQRAAATVIYTTHSIGCLPTDLGAAIRVVSPDVGRARSRISNTIWAADGHRVGITPLMLAMGANALAFTPARRAVIGEGATEAILLPALLREALPPKQLDEGIGYQVVPGISEVDPAAAHDLEMEAGAVGYLVDDDEGGRLHRRKLPMRAKRDRRVVVLGSDGPIFDLGDDQGGDVRAADDGLCIEDFVGAHVLTEAVNEVVQELSKRKGGVALTPEELPESGRGSHITAWAKHHHRVEDISKVRIAQTVLEIGRDSGAPLLERSRKEYLRALHKKLDRATKPPED